MKLIQRSNKQTYFRYGTGVKNNILEACVESLFVIYLQFYFS